jgi:hypothetical protein
MYYAYRPIYAANARPSGVAIEAVRDVCTDPRCQKSTHTNGWCGIEHCKNDGSYCQSEIDGSEIDGSRWLPMARRSRDGQPDSQGWT